MDWVRLGIKANCLQWDLGLPVLVVSWKANCPLVVSGLIGGVPTVEVFLRLGCWIKADYPHVGPGPVGEETSGIFLRNASPYLR